MSFKIITSENFSKEVLENPKPVLADFFATWCGPCKMFGPIFEKASEKFDNVDFAKIDVDLCQDAANEYKIMSVPTIILFKDGKEVFRKSGALNPAELQEVIKLV